MRRFLIGFLIFVALYHIIVTFFSFGQGVVSPYVILLVRDIGWIIAVTLLAMTHRQTLRQHMHIRGGVWQVAILLVIVGILTSYFMGVDVSHIVVGIKYTLYYILPFLTSVYIGTYLYTHVQREQFMSRIHAIWVMIVVVIALGRLRQIAKMVYPDLFYQFGYGHLGDYVFGAKPPLYYLTGPNGFPRLSGIFSGPNNYGYFLVVFFGFFWYGVRTFITSKTSKVLLWILYIITVLATLSRGAILGILVEMIMISLVLYRTKKHIVIWAIVAGVVAVVGLSLLKRQSTVAHVTAKLHSLDAVSQSPWGYGLGSSGPSVHSEGGYLPENFFVQVMMDIGLHGFVLRAIFWLWILMKTRKIYLARPVYRSLVFFLTVGFVGIMFEGLFLHVLEDSMVNYLYFIVWGVVLGYVSANPELEDTSGNG